MRILVGFAIIALAAGSLAAQNRGGFVNSGNVTRTGSSVVFPAGTSAAPGVQRTAGSVVYPGGGGPQIGIPSAITNLNFPGHGGRPAVRANGRTGPVVYAYPVYVGGGYYDSSYAAQPQPSQQQPNVTVVYPPQPAPVIINQFGPGDPVRSSTVLPYQQAQPRAEQPEEAPAVEATHYLIAFKDHSIYSAVAYWVDGDTLHYFTTGNTHNQASVSLVDRELTNRLNQESGVEVKLPK